MAEEELLVTLCRGDSGSGGSFGFSLLGASASAGLPAAHVIYDIVENSPAARSGKIEQLATQTGKTFPGQPHFQRMK